MTNSELPKLKDDINTAFDRSLEHEVKSKDQRLKAGRLLLKAQRAVEEEIGKGQWEDWVKDNIDRSMRDCQKVMKAAASAYPHEAREEEKQKANESMAKSRAEAQSVNTADHTSNVGRMVSNTVQSDLVEEFVALYLRMNEVDRGRALRRIEDL